MPIYEYKCKSCECVFERLQSVSEDPIRLCPSCGGEVRRIFSPAGIIFKGSGFYITDSRKESGKTESESSSGED